MKDVTGTEINLIDEKGNASTLEVPYFHTLTTKADYFTNEDEGYRVDALGGNDSIENYAESVTVDGGDGNDEIYNVGNYSSILGGKGNDSIDNFADNVTINGGAGNDYIFSAGEENIFQYASGDGKDSIFGYSENDTIQITSGKLKNATVKGMDVILNVGSGSITLEDAAGKNINILDSAGNLTSTSLSGVLELTSKADTFENRTDNLTLKALGGNDKITNYGANVTIDGGTGHDRIYIEDGENNIVIGGKGNDTITNNGGENVLYKYATGDGNDVIYGFTENDSLQITKGSVTSITTSGNDTVLKIGTGSITLKDYVDDINFVGGANSRTLDILYDNNFMTDDINLDSITEAKYSVTEIQNNKVEDFAQDSTLLTFAKEK